MATQPSRPVEPAAVIPTTEGSLIGRLVALLTPVLVVGAGWLAGVVAHAVPGVKLDKSQIVAFMVAAATSVLGSAWKWLQGWQQHEMLVAQNLAQPVRAPKPTKRPRGWS